MDQLTRFGLWPARRLLGKRLQDPIDLSHQSASIRPGLKAAIVQGRGEGLGQTEEICEEALSQTASQGAKQTTQVSQTAIVPGTPVPFEQSLMEPRAQALNDLGEGFQRHRWALTEKLSRILIMHRQAPP
jgi:hypothetical protein